MWSYPNPADLSASNEARVAQLLREIDGRRAKAPRIHPVRRWIGRQLVRVGAQIAADPSLRPARSL